MCFKKEYTLSSVAVGSLKLATAAFVIWLIKIWPSAMKWVYSTNIWVFVVIFVLAAIKPLSEMNNQKKTSKKKK